MKITKVSFIGWICGLTLLITSNVFSQGSLKDTIWIPVTYYDFHSDGSNPEFEQDHPAGVFKGMVEKFLDEDGKPVPTGDPDKICMNSYIKYWFRPFEDSARGDFTVPTYNPITGRQTGTQTVATDQAFVNIVIKDSLRFTRVQGTNIYGYDNIDFFPLDKYAPPASFGIENIKNSNIHNYAFTMHLHFTFTKTDEAQAFRFRGDDDVWAFIDDSLVMDLGGIHEPTEGSFTVAPWLLSNKEYSFDLFFAERHSMMSIIRIETNLFKPRINHNPPTLLSPSNNAANVAVPTTLNWEAVDGVSSYNLLVSNSPDFSTQVIYKTGLISNTYQATSLSNNTQYFWVVSITNSDGIAQSPVWTFTTIADMPDPVQLITPLDGDTIHMNDIALVWNKGATNVTKYRIELSTDSTMTNAIVDSTIDTVKVFSQLKNNSKYWWRVRACNAAGWGNFSQTAVFHVDLPVSVICKPEKYDVHSFGSTSNNSSLRYALPVDCYVNISLFDLDGRVVQNIMSRKQCAGRYSIPISRLAKGAYILKFRAGTFSRNELLSIK
jgi:fibro-slime domain-containing protein